MVSLYSQGAELHILVVDDSLDDAELIRLVLKKGGLRAKVRVVENESGMRQAMRERIWDVVLSDYSLPGFNVREALSILREADADTPFVVVSGAIGEENVITLMKEGVNDFVMKKNLARLVPVIEHVLTFAQIQREHRQAIQNLRENEKLLRGVTSALGEGLFVQDKQGRLVLMNPEAERLLGWSEQELLGRNAMDLVCVQSPGKLESGNFGDEWLNALARGREYKSDEDIFVCKNGLLMAVSFIASPIIEHDEVIAAVIAFQDISLRKKVEQDLVVSREQLRELSAHLQSVREEERSRISRELHDGLGQMLAAIKLDAKWLAERQGRSDVPVTKKHESMINMIDRTVDAMRMMAANLRPVMLDDLGLIAALEWLSEEVAEHSGLSIKLRVSKQNKLDIEAALSEDIKTALYRIAQECLTNVVRHAEASNILISLNYMFDKVLLVVSDDGQGTTITEKEKKDSYGLIGMRERAYKLGGELSWNSIPGEGVSVEVEIPLKSSAISRSK